MRGNLDSISRKKLPSAAQIILSAPSAGKARNGSPALFNPNSSTLRAWDRVVPLTALAPKIQAGVLLHLCRGLLERFVDAKIRPYPLPMQRFPKQPIRKATAQGTMQTLVRRAPDLTFERYPAKGSASLQLSYAGASSNCAPPFSPESAALSAWATSLGPPS